MTEKPNPRAAAPALPNRLQDSEFSDPWWKGAELDPSPAASSGAFGRIFRSTVKASPLPPPGAPECRRVQLNLHRIPLQGEEILDDDAESSRRPPPQGVDPVS